jgi:hypothetical protein
VVGKPKRSRKLKKANKRSKSKAPLVGYFPPPLLAAILNDNSSFRRDLLEKAAEQDNLRFMMSQLNMNKDMFLEIADSITSDILIKLVSGEITVDQIRKLRDELEASIG